MITLSGQGGGCCGRKIIHNFGDPASTETGKLVPGCPCNACADLAARASNGTAPKTNEQLFDGFMADFRKISEAYVTVGKPVRGKAVEAVLTDSQLRTLHGQFWSKKLRDEGFRFIGRFDNNSGGRCNIFMWSDAWVDGSPEGW